MKIGLEISKPFQKWSSINKRIKIAFGGRGGTKTYSCIFLLMIKSFMKEYKNMAFIIARQTLRSIEKSSYALLKRIIIEKGLESYFTMTKSYIENKITKVRFYFVGIREVGIAGIKSIDNIKYFFIEEAEELTAGSWIALEPTVRGKDADGNDLLSEIWMIFNPRYYYDFSYSLVKNFEDKLKEVKYRHDRKEYKYYEYEDDDRLILKVNYYSNSFHNASLEASRQLCLKENPTLYNHVWLGEVKTASGKIFGASQLRYYDFETYKQEIEPHYTKKAIIDPAFGRENCFTSCVIYSQVGNDFYIIDAGLMRTDANNTTDEAITNFLKQYGIREVMCEANFHQQELVKRLKRNFEVQPFYQKINKIERIVDNAIKIREHILFDEQSLHAPDGTDTEHWLKTREGRNYIAMMQLFNFSDIPSDNCIKENDFSYIDFVDVITSLVMYSKKRYVGESKVVSFGNEDGGGRSQYQKEIDNRIASITRKGNIGRLGFGFNN